jgi:hypothetical protein
MAIVKRLVKGSALTHSELDGNFTDLDTRVTTLENTNSDSQTLTLSGTDLIISNGNTVDLSSLSGGGGSSYGDSDVDTHLNTSTATANQILSWDGSDYVWVADQTGGGSSGLSDVVDDTTPQLGGDLDVNGRIITAASMNVAINPPAGGMLHLGFGTADAHSVRMYDMYAFPKAVPNTGDVLTAGAVPNELEWAAPAGGSSYGDSDVATFLNGNLNSHIIPDTNATYDIGSAEYKIRHFYLSDNSLKFTDTSDPQNIVEYGMGRNGANLTFNGSALKSTSAADATPGVAVDLTKTNHFVTTGENYTVQDGTYVGQELHFWINSDANPGSTSFTIAIMAPVKYWQAGTFNQGPNLAWQPDYSNNAHHHMIWDGTHWVLNGTQSGV